MTKKKKSLLVAAIIIIAVSGFVIYGALHTVRNCCALPPLTICQYDTILLPAKIVSITTDTDEAFIKVQVNTSDGVIHDFVYEDMFPFKRITKTALAQSGLRVGDFILCTWYKLSKQVLGKCSPENFSLTFKKYTPTTGKPPSADRF